jgi:hypothetical protein
MTNDTLIVGLADELRDIASLLETAVIDTQDSILPLGTIVKALPNQTRFKPKSLWVSLGDGTYKHLTGKKGLIAKHERLDGYVDVIFDSF